jgi:hypothetical protein
MSWFEDGAGDGLARLLDWLEAHPALLEGVLAASVLTFVGSLLVLPVLVAAIPRDYFAHKQPPPPRWKLEHPALRMLVLGLRNLLGALLLFAGLVMLVTPGQGILTILVGISLLTLPGKRAFEIAIVRRPGVLRALNWVRARAGKPPLEVLQRSPPSVDSDSPSA